MNARAVAAWSACSLFIILSTTSPVYKLMVLAAAVSVLAAGAGLRRIRALLVAVLFIGTFATLLNFVSAHLGATVLFALPAQIPALGGPYTLEAMVFAASGVALVAFAGSHATGSAGDWFPYPTLTLPTIHPVPTAGCLLLLAPVIVWRSRR